ncbi:NnrS family protein [Gelidibacter sp. F2691]|nr:NnrS family protein [Gelidibacter sp. F2691]
MTILTGAYRLFFPAALLFAGAAIPLWIISFAGAISPNSDPTLWHQHEMLWGYLPAALAGFLFTAIPNWTGRPAIGPAILLALFLLWFAGRAAMFSAPDALWAQIVTTGFLPAVAVLAARDVVLADNRRNLVVIGMIFALSLSQILFLWMDRDTGLTAGFSVALLMLVHIGGRVTPAFSRNWLKKRGATKLPPEFGLIDRTALIATVVTVAFWIVLGSSLVTGLSAGLAAIALSLRLSRWSGWSVRSEPLLLALHMAYLWLAISTALLAAACLSEFTTIGQVHHALGAGAVGTMTVIVMLRALLGHSGRPIQGNLYDWFLLATLHAGAAIRVAADWASDPSVFYHAGGTLWAVGMLAAAIRAFPIAITPRL